VIGGLGSDTFNVAGDVTSTVISQDLNGRSAVINQGTASTADATYDKLLVDGIALTIADQAQGKVVIEETGGGTELVEDSGGIDSYQISLFKPATLDANTVAYLTVSCDAFLVLRSPAADSSTFDAGGPHEADTVLISTDGGVTWVESAVIKFTFADWNVKRTIQVKAAHDDVKEGERKVMISHSVLVVSPSAADKAMFDEVAIPNVEVRVLDDDLGTLLIRQTDGATRVLEGTTAQSRTPIR
jgi:hypothetical protein